MQFIILILQVYLGLIFFWAFEAHKYIVSGEFKFSMWRAKNLTKFIWTAIMCFMFSLILIIDPASMGFAFKFVGIDIANELGESSMSGIIVGLLVGYMTNRLVKEKRTDK